MADRTSQPADGVGVNSIYTTPLFLWNAIAPTKNQLNGATATLKGTTVSGAADGQYHLFTTAGAMEWTINALGANAPYTLALLGVHPTASVAYAKLFALPGGGVRVESQTTGGGVYYQPIHTTIGALTENVNSVGGFNTEMWSLIIRFSGTQTFQYTKRGDGTTATRIDNTLGMAASGTTLQLGDDGPLASQGLYAAMLLSGDVGDTEALALRDNGWRMFAPAVTYPPEGTFRPQHKKIRRPGRGPYSKGVYKRPSLDVLPQTFWVDGGAEAVAASESADANAAFAASATDSVTPTDSADRSGDVISAASDAANATDSADATGVFVSDATDAATAIDAATSDQKPVVLDRTGTNAPRPGRTPYSLGRLFRPRVDVFNNTFPTTGNDSAAAADASSTNIVGVAAASEAAAAADSAAQAGVFAASASDSISINDVAASTAAGDRQSIDAVNAIDSADAIIVGTAIATQAHALADTADSSLFGNVLFASESFAAAEVADAAGSVYVSSAAEAQLLAALASAVKVGVFEPTANSRVRVDSKARVAKGRIGGRRI
jgi:hypothetical protein